MFDVSMNGEEVEEIVDGTELAKSEPVDIKTSPVMRQRRGRQGRNEVKIYDRIIEGKVAKVFVALTAIIEHPPFE